MNIFKTGEMGEMGKGGATQNSDSAFLDFPTSPEDTFFWRRPLFTVRSTALSHALELSSSTITSGTIAFRKKLRLHFFGIDSMFIPNSLSTYHMVA